MQDFTSTYPQIKINLHTGSSTLQLPKLLKQDIIHLAILRGDFNWAEFKYVLSTEPLCLIYPSPLTIEQLPSIPWIRYETSKLTKSEDDLNVWWKNHFSSTHSHIIRVDSIEAAIQMVSHKLGWCIIPQIHLDLCKTLYCSPIYQSNQSPILRKTLLVCHEKVKNMPVYDTFINYIIQNYPV